MTLDQFNRERFGKLPRVPVTQLAKNMTASSTTNSDTRVPSALQQTILITAMNLERGAAVIQFTGTPRQQYILQASDSLNTADWGNIGTNRADAAGMGIFRDEESKNYPMRFYRIASP